MKTLLSRLILENWQRKLISLILAMIIWIVVHHSMQVTKTIQNIPVRVTHIPPGKTIEGMQTDGLLNKKIALTLTGNKDVMDELSSKDLEVIIDASNKEAEWIATIEKKNLLGLNPELNLQKVISRVAPSDMIIKQSKLVTEKIPVLVTQPIGEAPKGYQFLDVWPYQLNLTVTGPEDTVKKLKTRGLKLTFNLSDISKDELETLFAAKEGDEASFFIPNSWKKVSLPQLSETPVEIDDPQATALRIDFSRQDLIPIGVPISVGVFFPPKYSNTLNPETYSLAANDFIVKKNGIKMITAPLLAHGVSRLFLDTVKDMMQIVVVACPKTERETLFWSVEFLYPAELEDRYVARVMSESNEELGDVQPQLREDYLRNRFRSYKTRLRLYTSDHKKLSLKAELQGSSIAIQPQ